MWELLIASLGGGTTVKVLEKLLDHLWEERKRVREDAKSARILVNKHLDPILKAADEFVAKLRWLAQNDFKELEGLQYPPQNFQQRIQICGLLYLFADFWARIQLLREEGIYVNLSAARSGERLLAFVRTLEERETRLMDRLVQRGLGESLLRRDDGGSGVISLHEFVDRFRMPDSTTVGSGQSESLREWFEPLADLLTGLRHRGLRQKLLVYGIIVHALLDTLDPKHLIAGERPGWGNKLTELSRKDLEHRIFPEYLPFVEDPERYFRAP